MNLEFKALQTQQQQLRMTQELQQAIKVLQYNKEELTAYLEDKALDNPFLEVTIDQKSVLDKNRYQAKEGYHSDEDYIAQLPDQSFDLAMFLKEQVMLSMRSMKLREIVVLLIGNLDERGYLTITYDELVEALPLTAIEFENALTLLQQLDPAGIGARTLCECICLQIDRDVRAPKQAYRVISDYFDLFTTKKWQELAIATNLSITAIVEISEYVKTLTPFPGRRYNKEANVYISPDVRVTKSEGQLQIVPIKAGIPQVAFNDAYFKSVSHHTEAEVTTYLKHKKADFKWLQQVLAKRESTIVTVTQAIVAKQQSFFYEEHHPLQPLTFVEIAKLTNVHESTISRTVNHKYLETSFGVFELRSFFTTGISANTVSNKTVQTMIANIVAEEDKRKPLSDQKITDQLKKQGITISRRTVAKYRLQLNIAGTTQRKQY